MTIVIDASVIISALINPNGKEAAYIFNYSDKLDFVAPELVHQEIAAKSSRIIKSSHLTARTLQMASDMIVQNISIFSVSKYDQDILNLAQQLTDDIDPKDAQYIALTILLEGLFWTGDLKLLRGLRRKEFNYIITTLDLQQIIKGL